MVQLKEKKRQEKINKLIKLLRNDGQEISYADAEHLFDSIQLFCKLAVNQLFTNENS
ncbi:hypothetical protein Echvi_4154 [Echinicola vietnamensis DSM 17526]|uniref:Uncharacterized protein n=1 Tax=Echinicola vietnamensis (strain DSM 17526 / LMG 23754 / KMM 6221) TaxID=926556 RepID=L0G2A3_ECHVK|nr:hypothetical protein Echvi_4154 [Echinicola vietnamensis DSM 17526]